jgi:hypothetical protein
MARKTKDQLRTYDLDLEECDECEWFDGRIADLEVELCIYHQGFVDGFDFARTIPPVEMPMPTTIKVVAGTPRLNE